MGGQPARRRLLWACAAHGPCGDTAKEALPRSTCTLRLTRKSCATAPSAYPTLSWERRCLHEHVTGSAAPAGDGGVIRVPRPRSVAAAEVRLGGLRPNECRLLPRECVDLRTGMIRIEQVTIQAANNMTFFPVPLSSPEDKCHLSHRKVPLISGISATYL